MSENFQRLNSASKPSSTDIIEVKPVAEEEKDMGFGSSKQTEDQKEALQQSPPLESPNQDVPSTDKTQDETPDSSPSKDAPHSQELPSTTEAEAKPEKMEVDEPPSKLPGTPLPTQPTPEAKPPTSPQVFQQTEAWLRPQYHEDSKLIKKPDELVNLIEAPPDLGKPQNEQLFNRIAGSMLGMAIGDALGAHVEFRPREYLTKTPVTGFQSGGTWGLEEGQFTDDTSMALCLANSLIVCQGFDPYDQLVRYKWWHQKGYMSSTGRCFDIGAATRQSIDEFRRRQRKLAADFKVKEDELDFERKSEKVKGFDVYCSEDGVAGNGALMRLAPVPLFFHRHPELAVEYAGQSGQITHGDIKAYDACRYYGALIVAALQGATKEELTDRNFYSKHKTWFGEKELDPAIKEIADGSYLDKKGYDGGIRGGGYIVKALEAALWAFSSCNTFEEGALAAVNLGDDTDTTAAIYGQLAGAYYTMEKLPEKWLNQVYAREFLIKISKWLEYEGEQWKPPQNASASSK